MICNKCGENLAEDSEFCMACGNSVKEQTEQQEAEAQSCENQEQFNDESVQPPKRSKKKTLLCVIAVVLALAFVLGSISSAVAIFSGAGPISEIGEALENGIEDGFAFEFTLAIPDESEYTVKGVTLGTSDDENAIPVTYLTIGDTSYYVDNDCVCVLDETTMNLLNLNYKEEGDEQSSFSLMKEILAADLEKLIKFEDFCDLAEYLNCFAGERSYDEGGFEKCADRIANNLKDKDYLKEKNADHKLFGKLREVCPSIKNNATNLSMLATWRAWKFSDEMILEAAKRSVGSANPIPYMNKILSDWKRQQIFAIKDIPESKTTGAGTSSTQNSRSFATPMIEAINAKADRERYYALLREKALSRADKFTAQANKNKRFKEVTSELSKMEIALAKAEVFDPTKLPALTEEKAKLLQERREILHSLGIDEADLQPQYACMRCSDTGFLPSGVACNCYKAN